MHWLTCSSTSAASIATAPALQLRLMQHLRIWICAFGLLLCLLPLTSSHASFLRTTVDNAGDVGLENSMQLNASGLAVISYYDVTNGNLKLATCFFSAFCDGFFAITTVDSGGNVGRFTSLQLNASGFAVISYYDITNGDLKLAVCNDVNCTAPTLTTVDSAGNVGQYTSLRLNASGFPVISYQDVTNGDLKIAVCGDATCSTSTITTVDSAVNTGQHTSLQLNASGFPVISYFDSSTSGALRLAVCGDAICSTATLSTVDSSLVGTHTSLRLNASGFPVISYWDISGENLKLAVCDDATCTTATRTTVDNSAGDVGRFTSLQLNASGFAVISYWDGTNSDLKLAVCNDATCSAPALTTVDSFGSLGQHTSLQLNASGLAVISYFDITNTSLKFVTTVPASVNSVSVPASANYVTGQNLDFTINFTDPITVTGSPVLSLTIGAATRNATYLSGSGTAALVFRHTVLAGDVDNNGISVGSLALSGGTLNWAGFPAALGLNLVGNTAGVLVNQSFTVTPSAGANGSITPNTAQFVVPGATIAFTVTPDSGYSASVGGTCGGTLVGTTYTTSAINADCTVIASFTQITYTVTPSAGANGSITPNTLQVVASGSTAVFTVTPSMGFVATVGGTCGGTLVGTLFTSSAITANCTVAATFAVAPVTTFVGPSATGTGNISASFTGGGAGCTFMPTPQYIPVSGHPRSPPAGTAPPGVVFPQGLFDFTTTGCTAASTITMTVTYPNPLPAGTQYWKYGPTPTDPVPHWYVLPATIVGNTATFSITDGQLGDDDLVANGTIVDQGGPGAGAASGASIPTLSEWAMMLLALAMMAFAARRRRS